MKHLFVACCLMMALVMTASVWADDASLAGDIPPELGRWRSWVLHGHEKQMCPSAFNNGQAVRCQWPSRLALDIALNGGQFEQDWVIYADGWVDLPGSPDVWPDSVLVDGRPAAVVSRDKVPSVWLETGEYRLEGRFDWPRMPEVLHVPPSVGLLSLTVEGRKIETPVMDIQGRLWLQEQTAETDGEQRFKISVFRLIDDDIPMKIITLLRLDISGQGREIRLPKVLLPNAVPMALESALPARLDSDRQLIIQARPGRWEIRVIARMPEMVHKLGVGDAAYGNEVWSFQPRHDLRMVEIEDVSQVEPGQTEMPDAWRGFSAYLMKPEAIMRIKEIRRGDPDPVPDQLTLFRNWWLDFDGQAFSLQDRITGTLSRQWYLAMNPPVVLGRVAVDGRDQVITAQGTDRKAGVELRQGRLDLQGDARLPMTGGAMNAVGWDHDFHNVRGQLHLPPGWRLLAVAGVDQVSHTWLQNWSLLDFFLVLIITLAVYKLRNWRWALLTLVTLALIYHEPGAPRLVWLHILAVLALLPLLAKGWFKRLVSLWGAVAVIVLLCIAVPFIVHQVRWGLYPQLAPHNDDDGFAAGAGDFEREMSVDAMVQEAAPEPLSDAPKRRRLAKAFSRSEPSLPSQMKLKSEKAVWHQDPDALIPTGPGLPEWHWNSIQLTWNGPVAKDQDLRLLLISPRANLFLALLRVVLLGVLVWGVVDWRPWWHRIQNHLKLGMTVSLTAMVLLLSTQARPVMAAENDFPSAQLLEELRKRLLEPLDCLPSCADISRMEVAASGHELRLMLKINAAGQSAIPLPVNRKSWQPEQVLLDNARIGAMARDEAGILWTVVPAGVHTLVLLGSVDHETMVQIPFPLKPHIATYTVDGWEVKGIMPDGTMGSSLQLSRIADQSGERQGRGDKGRLPAFLHVRRVLRLGLSWQVETLVERVTPIGSPIVAGIPLMAGEAVTTAGVQVDGDHVLVNMSADQQRMTYVSTLKTADLIELTAPRAVPWTETWVLDASPIWHCDLAGIPVIHHQDDGGRWQPQWRPWPGEKMSITVSRPQSLEGQVLTIQRAQLNLTPGQRFAEGELTLAINSSRGGQHTLWLPPKANLLGVVVAGKSLPVRQEGQQVTIPLQPGLQNVTLRWHQLVPFAAWFKAPEIKIGHAAVNARVTLHMPQKRWILLAGGPQWGPAVLFWSYLTVIILAAIGLGRLTLTPLKTYHWILLGLGLTQVPAPMALIIVSWLLVLGGRGKRPMPNHWFGFNMIQLGIVALTLVAMVSLFEAVKSGLIGWPDMQIQGNGSTVATLNWTQDRIAETLPRPWVLSLPIWYYRGFMLVWSLWLAYALLTWIRWGWQCFVQNDGWRKRPVKPKAKKQTES